ncbi:hypothetical protein D3C71_1721090 [compost metagenome]
MPLTKTVRSQKSGTLPRLWVETSMTRPSSRRALSNVMICSSVVTSTPVKGSSSRMTWPSWASARARKTRLRWPPESSPIWRLRYSSMFTRFSASVTMSWSRRDGMRRKFMWP